MKKIKILGGFILNDIELKVINALSEILTYKSDINLDDNIVDLGINSVHFIKLVVELEEAYNFEFAILDYKKFITVRDISRYVEKNRE